MIMVQISESSERLASTLRARKSADFLDPRGHFLYSQMASTKQIIKTLEILKKFQKGIRKTTLNREAKENKNYTPYQTLISCLLSLRVKDEVTEKISKDLFKVAKTPKEMLKLPIKRL